MRQTLLDDLILDASTKGVPTHVGHIRCADVGAAGWNLHRDLQLPAAILRRSALDANGRWMRAFVERSGAVLCPHGKTTMAPRIFARQLADGAWGLTCATIGHLRTYRRFGVQRVIFANQIPSKAGAAWLAGELARDPGFEAYVFVDSVEGADILAHAAKATGLDRPIPVLLEVGYPGARTGARDRDTALALARHVASLAGRVSLAGVATFEGVLPGGDDRSMEPHVEALFAEVVGVAEACARERLFDGEGPVILSAGGSRFFDLAAKILKAADLGRETLIVLRSGCYVSHDAAHYERAFSRLVERAHGDVPGRLRSALEVWAQVQSHPEPTRFYANIGRRDVSYDLDLPKPLSWFRPGVHTQPQPLTGVTVTSLSDQHVHLLAGEDCPLQIGDQIGFGISHPCTTFDKWRVLYEVDDEGGVTDAIATFF
jgi:D-serine dehydratase